MKGRKPIGMTDMVGGLESVSNSFLCPPKPNLVPFPSIGLTSSPVSKCLRRSAMTSARNSCLGSRTSARNGASRYAQQWPFCSPNEPPSRRAVASRLLTCAKTARTVLASRLRFNMSSYNDHSLSLSLHPYPRPVTVFLLPDPPRRVVRPGSRWLRRRLRRKHRWRDLRWVISGSCSTSNALWYCVIRLCVAGNCKPPLGSVVSCSVQAWRRGR